MAWCLVNEAKGKFYLFTITTGYPAHESGTNPARNARNTSTAAAAAATTATTTTTTILSWIFVKRREYSYVTWQQSFGTGAAAFKLRGVEASYCHLSVVLLFTNTRHGSASPVTESMRVGTQLAVAFFNCCHGATIEYQILC
jgi:hypothetical protein